MEKSTLGARVKLARKDMGVTSEKLAELCNINATYLRQIESGRKIPSLPVFITICRQLRVTPTYILLDSLDGDENRDVDALMGLLRAATPGQLKLITAMINTALESLPHE